MVAESETGLGVEVGAGSAIGPGFDTVVEFEAGIVLNSRVGLMIELASGLGNALGGGLGRSSRIEPGMPGTRSRLDLGDVYGGGLRGGLGVGW
jgi:hypothetical protein